MGQPPNVATLKNLHMGGMTMASHGGKTPQLMAESH